MRKASVAWVAGLLLIIGSLLAPSPANAAWGSYLVANKYYTVQGMQILISGTGYQYNWGCGLKDCDQVSQVYGFIGRSSGEVHGNKARIKVSTTFTGASMGFSAGGSASGPSGSASISPMSNGCGLSEWYESRDGSRQVSVDTGDGVFCKASTYAWICSVKLTTAGAIRFGDQWIGNSASDTEDVGC